MTQINKTSVGLDISMNTYCATIAVLNGDLEIDYLGYGEFENNKKGFNNMEKWLKSFDLKTEEFHFTMEATGVYYEKIANYLYLKNHSIHVVLANKIKRFTESLDVKSKTDKIDSKNIAQFGIERKLKNWQPPIPYFAELKSLTRERANVIKVRTQFKNNLHALNHSHSPNKGNIRRLNSIIKSLDTQVKEIEAEIRLKSKSDVEIKEKIDKLTSIPGVAEITAITIVAETNGFALIENAKQLSSYAGLDVRLRESGKWKGQSKISKKGNSFIRGALYFPALTAIRCNNEYKSTYERITTKKKSKVGITAISRKLLVLIYSLWKNEITYQNNYKDKKAA